MSAWALVGVYSVGRSESSQTARKKRPPFGDPILTTDLANVDGDGRAESRKSSFAQRTAEGGCPHMDCGKNQGEERL